MVNDFSIHVGTVNGSGSQTANNILLRAILQMGIPVSGKNLFPSNIAGLPTWFTIRVSEAGYVARRARNDVLVVMNPETAAEDVAAMGPGSAIVINDSIKLPEVPADRVVYRVPMAKLMESITTDVKLRRLVVNMIYVGVVAQLLGVEMPDMFIQQNPIVNAFTYGVEKPYIVLFSGLLEKLSEDETLAVISHEVGHIHAEHVLYLTAARLMEALANVSVGMLVPGSEIIKFIVSAGIGSALLAWARKAELSCDRAALLVTQDPHAIGRTMMKLAGGTSASKIDYDLFLEQGREFQKNYDEKFLDRFWANIINSGLTHPLPVWRVSEILVWVDSGQYADLMAKE